MVADVTNVCTTVNHL